MSNTKNSISSLIAQFLRLQKNSLEIINKLSEVTTSPNDNVEVEFINDDNTIESIQIPSFGFFKNEIKRLDQNIMALSGMEDATANVRKPDGTVAKIYTASLLKDPSAPTSLQVPSTFKTRNNWFFESFLNPLLYVSLNVENQIPAECKKVVVRRVIADTQTDAKKSYFDTNLKGKNDLTYDQYISALSGQGIGYFIDESIVDLPLQIIRYKGNFSVLRIFDEKTTVTVGGNTQTTTTRKYKLDTLRYTDILANTNNSRTLVAGDSFITPDGTKFEITAVDTSESTVVLKRVFGFGAIQNGANALSIYSSTLSPRTVDVNVGHDERQSIFIKTIEDKFNVAGSTFSPGICIWTNELNINTSEGVKTLDEFYKLEVADFGQQFLASAKEKLVPSIYGLVPNTPSLSTNNFKVVQVNKQVTDSKVADTFKQKIQSKVSIKNDIEALDKSIDLAKKQLNDLVTTNTSGASNAEFQKLTSKIDQLSKTKATKTNLLSSTITDLNNLVQTAPEISEAPKHRIRGFWPIPNAVEDPKTGAQEVIQFKVRYRYLSKGGNTQGTEEISFVDNNGNQKKGAFSNWIEFKTDIRKKIFDEATGKYIWKIENVEDADTPNINQLDIPITKGEKVEIKVASISEAGWPQNPLESPFSDSVIIDFPDDLSVQIDNGAFLAQNSVDTTLVQMQQDLAARGLDTHLSESFTSGDKYYSHSTNSIASGFFDTSGNAIDLFQKLLQIDQELSSLKALIAKAKGTLGVYLRQGSATNKIKNGSTVSLFAGYYDEIIDLTNPSNRGKIATVTYYLEIRNDAATPLELASLIPGGQSLPAPSALPVPNNDYDTNRKYGLTPIQLTGTTTGKISDIPSSTVDYVQRPPFQSVNANSQFVYTRYKSVGLNEDLYFTPSNTSSWTLSSGEVGPYPIASDGILIPFTPTSGSIPGASDPSIWNGLYTGTIPNGGGRLNEFCVHVNHPEIVGTGTPFELLIRPPVGTSPNYTLNDYPAFRHALGFELDAGSAISAANSGNQVSSIQQLQYIKPVPFDGTVFNASDSSDDTDRMFPAKLGFLDSDEFLVGKYSCGSYLYLAPKDHSSIQVEGSTSLAKRTLEFGEQNAIVIPIVFQFRAQDKLGFIGGWRSAGTLKNITYTKKIGIDIQVKNEDLFSFDILSSGSYTRTSLVSPAYAQSINTVS